MSSSFSSTTNRRKGSKKTGRRELTEQQRLSLCQVMEESDSEEDDELLSGPLTTLVFSQQSANSSVGNGQTSPSSTATKHSTKKSALISCANLSPRQEAIKMTRHATTTQVEDIVDPSLLRWHKIKSGHFPCCIRTNKDEGKDIVKFNKRDDTLIRYLGFRVPNAGRLAAASLTSLLPFDYETPGCKTDGENDDVGHPLDESGSAKMKTSSEVCKTQKHEGKKEDTKPDKDSENILTNQPPSENNQNEVTLPTKDRENMDTIDRDEGEKGVESTKENAKTATANKLEREEWSPVLMEQYKKSLQRRKNMTSSMVLAEELVLQRFLSFVIDRPRKQETEAKRSVEDDLAEETDPLSLNTEENDDEMKKTETSSESVPDCTHTKDENQKVGGGIVTISKSVPDSTNTHDEKPKSGVCIAVTSKDRKGKIKIRAGDVIEYYSLEAVACLDSIRRAKVIKVNTRNEIALELSDMSLLERDTQIRLVERVLRGQSIPTGFTQFVSLSTYALDTSHNGKAANQQTLASVLGERYKEAAKDLETEQEAFWKKTDFKNSTSKNEENQCNGTVRPDAMDCVQPRFEVEPETEGGSNPKTAPKSKDEKDSTLKKGYGSGKRKRYSLMDNTKTANKASYNVTSRTGKLRHSLPHTLSGKTTLSSAPKTRKRPRTTLEASALLKEPVVVHHPRIPRKKYLEQELEKLNKKKRRVDAASFAIQKDHLKLVMECWGAIMEVARSREEYVSDLDSLLDEIANGFDRSLESVWNFLDGNQNNILTIEKLGKMITEWNTWLSEHKKAKTVESSKDEVSVTKIESDR